MELTIILGLGLIVAGISAKEALESKMKKSKVPVKSKSKRISQD